MKKIIVLAVVVISAISCSTLKNTATYRDFNTSTPYAVPVIADLNVSQSRIVYTYVPPKSIQIGGTNNVINTAVREALSQNGNADVLIGLETSIRYNALKMVESIVVSGYPAKYKDFRSLDEKIWYETPYFQHSHQLQIIKPQGLKTLLNK